MNHLILKNTLHKYISYIGGIDTRQIIFKFPNGYGASLIHIEYNNSLEVAVLYDDHLCYDTSVTNDVVPIRSSSHLNEVLNSIKDLPPKGEKTC